MGAEGFKRRFTVVVPLADIESRHAAKLSERGRTPGLPSSQPGAVAMAEVLDESVNAAAQQVVASRGLRLAAQPRVDVVTLPRRPDGQEQQRDLEFKLEIELLPAIPIPEFATLTLTKLMTQPSTDEIDTALTAIAAHHRAFVLVEEARGAAWGEMLSIDFTGRVDGTAFDGGAGTEFSVEVGGPGFFPGFTEQLEGMAAGETREIRVMFPAGHGVTELAGKAAAFAVTAKALYHPVPAALDDALAGRLGFATLEELRDSVRRQMQRECDQMSRLRLKRELMDSLSSAARFAVPATMVESEFEQIWQAVAADREDGRADEEDRGKDEAVLRVEYRAIAERRVRLGLLLAAIGQAEGVVIGADEMTGAMRAEAARYAGQEDQLMEYFANNPAAAEGLRGPLFEEKVVDFIIGRVSIKEKAVTPEELAVGERAMPGPQAAP